MVLFYYYICIYYNDGVSIYPIFLTGFYYCLYILILIVEFQCCFYIRNINCKFIFVK